ncbi:MAG: UvrD-helicase domain-containing protein [Armatimonadetes bacterium]|nr:UvrD-helicase domain-containing protein [Armatimonadota bacterium]
MAGLLDQLNPQQRVAAEITEGPVLIFAGAGSGKTRTLTYRLAHMVREKGVPVEQILAVTFTNKAAGELKERIAGLIGDEAKKLWVGTFHSICARILRQEGEAIGIPPNFTIYDEADQAAVVKEALSVLDGDSDESYSASEILNRISRAKNELLDVQGYRRTRKGPMDEMAQRVYAYYEQRLRANAALDFDDLLMRTVELLETKRSVLQRLQDRLRYILVDEYQDINHAQYRLIQLLGGKSGNICVVGDDDQSIYGWRGANVGIILAFESDYPNCKVVKLEQNYRSTKRILACAHDVIRRNAARADKRLWTDNHEGDKVVVYQALNEEEEAEWVTSVIRGQVNSGNARPGDYAILYRTNAMSRQFEDKLLEKGLPYEIVGGLRFYDRAVIRDALAYLKVISNPADGFSLRRIINRPARGIGAKTLAALDRLARRENITLLEACGRAQEAEGLTDRARAAALDFHHLMRRLADQVDQKPLPHFVRDVLDSSGYLAALTNSEKSDERSQAEDLGELITVAAKFAERREDSSLSAFLEHLALISDIDRAENLDSRVSLLTLHSAKGLEFPIVFMVGLEEEVFPHRRSMDDPFELEEERRLCYVGMTRAERMLYLSYANSRTVFGSRQRQQPSRFLKDLSPEHIERRGDLEHLLLPPRPKTEDEVLRGGPPRSRIDLTALLARAKENQSIAAERQVAEGAVAGSRAGNGQRTGHGGKAGSVSGEKRFRAGTKVTHKKFGQGIVVSASDDGEVVLTIAFPQVGVKKILASAVEAR